MTTDLWLDYMGIRLDTTKAAGMKFVINLVTPDNGEKYVVELRNSTLTNIKGQQAKNPDLTITVNRTDLEQVMGGTLTFDDLLKSGHAKFVGDREPFDQLKNMLVQFDPIFEIIPGTLAEKPKSNQGLNPFQQERLSIQTTSD